MTDRELLELAAKAAGAELDYTTRPDGKAFYHSGRNALALAAGGWFAPLADDGDALRLAVKCGIGVLFDLQDEKVTSYEQEPHGGYHVEFADDQGPSAATRRAIVRAAAAIGKAMP